MLMHQDSQPNAVVGHHVLHAARATVKGAGTCEHLKSEQSNLQWLAGSKLEPLHTKVGLHVYIMAFISLNRQPGPRQPKQIWHPTSAEYSTKLP